MVDFTRFKEIETEQAELASEKIAEAKSLCDAKLKELGLNTGDKVKNIKTEKYGLLVGIRLAFNYSFEITAKPVEKDGSPSAETAHLVFSEDNLKKGWSWKNLLK